MKSKRLPNGDIEFTMGSRTPSIIKVDEMIDVYYGILNDNTHPLQKNRGVISSIYSYLIEHLMIKILRDHANYNFSEREGIK